MRILAAALVVLAAAAPSAASAPQDSRPADTNVVVRLPLRDGKLSLLALARTVYEAAGLDPRTLEFSDREVQIDGLVGSIALFAIETAARDALGFDRTADALLVTIDRARVRELKHQVKHGLASWLADLTGLDLTSHEYTLDLPEPADAREPVVLLVHGMGGDGETFAAMRRALAERGFAAGEFRYSSDEGIDVIAKELADRLCAYSRRQPSRPIYVVAHSMGGLVARYALETPGVDPGNVRFLAMLGTPNGGSYLSRMRVALDLVDLAIAPKRAGKLDESLRNLIGSADADLKPGSVALEMLNARARNPAVEYRALIGTRAPLRAKELESLREMWGRASTRVPYAEALAPTLRAALDDLEEVEDGKGDGAVAIRRAELPGVEATRIDLDHQGLTRSRRAHAQVIQWLAARRAADRAAKAAR